MQPSKTGSSSMHRSHTHPALMECGSMTCPSASCNNKLKLPCSTPGVPLVMVAACLSVSTPNPAASTPTLCIHVSHCDSRCNANVVRVNARLSVSPQLLLPCHLRLPIRSITVAITWITACLLVSTFKSATLKLVPHSRSQYWCRTTNQKLLPVVLAADAVHMACQSDAGYNTAHCRRHADS